jgi:hypothetical protein
MLVEHQFNFSKLPHECENTLLVGSNEVNIPHFIFSIDGLTKQTRYFPDSIYRLSISYRAWATASSSFIVHFPIYVANVFLKCRVRSSKAVSHVLCRGNLLLAYRATDHV